VVTGGNPVLSMQSSLVSLRGVGKSFERGTVALEGFDLDVRPGEFVTLLGPSGCGKSTALRIIAGLGAPSSGTVTWQTSDEEGAAVEPKIGFVFQEPTLMPWANVADNVRLPLKLAQADAAAAQAAVDRALGRVGLADFAKSYPRELSGGMKMRTAIARALVTEPQLLLMDEPFAAVDEIARFGLNNELLKLWQELGQTVVFVTHSVFEAVFLSQRVVVMTPRPGKVSSDIRIDAPYPRDETFLSSAIYTVFCRMVSAALVRAMAESAP
jgi:NitT/TauT family transport system ATP-binding protein